ncbi:TIGR03621 family F420-dependent LLM class oxidoreductase [Microbacterium sp. NPDC019599]|uniref:TIGR03621 family F420-dependent LLM class oxidoreductase n=1 Tax=Microbacterium sp. NPDC019599 TaxID=3154690 RepID=UPI0033DB3194
MVVNRRFRFATGGFYAPSAREYAGLARKVEDLGYAALLLPDHFGEQLSPFAALVAAANATTTLRVGTFVCDNDFRHPAVLAKEAATVDLLTDGRLELGIGAGYLGPDYAKTGIPYDDAGTRVSRLFEAVTVVKGLLGPTPVTYSGEYYRIADLDGFPKPRQQPYPPLLIAGGGQRMLSFAAREADIVGLIMKSREGALDFEDGSVAATARRVDWVRTAAGTRFDDLELNILILDVRITADRRDGAAQIGRTWGISADQVLDSVHFLVGTTDQIADQLQDWRDQLSISYIAVMPEFMDQFAPVVSRLAGT